MNKKLLIIIVSAIITIAIVGGLIYYFMIRQPTTKEIPEEAKLTPEEIVRLDLSDGESLEDKIAKIEEDRRLALERGEEIEPIDVEVATVKTIKDDDIVNTTLSPDGNNLYYYDPDQGEFYKSNLDGSNSQAITSANFENVYDVEWSEKKDKAVIAFSDNDGEDKEYALFDINTQQVTRYDKKYQSVSLSPEQDQIAYLYKDDETGTSNISVADPYDTSDYNSLGYYSQSDIDIKWLSEKDISVETNSEDVSGFEERNMAVHMTTDGNTFRAIVGDQYSAQSKKSPDKSKAIINQSDVKNPREIGLYYIDSYGYEEPQYLGIDTLVTKCAWANDNVTVYCGVPDFWPNNMIMPDDYIEGDFISTDSFYKIDTKTLTPKLIASSTEFSDITYDVKAPKSNVVSKDKQIFYFKNRLDSKLYSLIIPSSLVSETTGAEGEESKASDSSGASDSSATKTDSSGGETSAE